MNFLEQTGQARILASEGNQQLAAALAKGVRKKMRQIRRWLREALIAVSSETSYHLQATSARTVRKDQS